MFKARRLELTRALMPPLKLPPQGKKSNPVKAPLSSVWRVESNARGPSGQWVQDNDVHPLPVLLPPRFALRKGKKGKSVLIVETMPSGEELLTSFSELQTTLFGQWQCTLKLSQLFESDGKFQFINNSTVRTFC